MTVFQFICVVLSVASLVSGQIIIKKAMGYTHDKPLPWKKFLLWFVPGIAIMTFWFLLWLTLLQTLDLSYLFPFESLSAIFLTIGAAIFLHEKLTLRLWIGIILIVLGVMFVAQS